MCTVTLSGVVPAAIEPRIFMVVGDWLPDQVSTLSPSTFTVAFSGSMHTCDTCSEKKSALITLAAPFMAAAASPLLSISTPG